jgi:hypothetical protein
MAFGSLAAGECESLVLGQCRGAAFIQFCVGLPDASHDPGVGEQFEGFFKPFEIFNAENDSRRPAVLGDDHPSVLALQPVDHLGQAVLHIGEGKVLGGAHGYKHSHKSSGRRLPQSESLTTRMCTATGMVRMTAEQTDEDGRNFIAPQSYVRRSGAPARSWSAVQRAAFFAKGCEGGRSSQMREPLPRSSLSPAGVKGAVCRFNMVRNEARAPETVARGGIEPPTYRFFRRPRISPVRIP